MVITDKSLKPPAAVWAKHGEGKAELAEWLINGCWKMSPCSPPSTPQKHGIEYEGYDGFYNNLAHPDLGAIGNVSVL